MTGLGYRIRCLSFLRVGAGVSAVAWAARRAALAGGLGLWLFAGGPALAAAPGEAEAAPDVPEYVDESAAARSRAAEPRPVMSPARIVAHTAELPKAAPKAGGKPGKSLFPAELSGVPSGTPPAARAPSRPAESNDPVAAGQAPGPTPTVKLTGPKLAMAKGQAPAPAAARRVRLSLAPSAAEIRREIATRNGGPATTPGSDSAQAPLGTGEPAKESAGARLQERATAAPVQNRRWPTHVDYSAGPSGPAGGNTAGDRKGALIESTGPQQGVIRNRW